MKYRTIYWFNFHTNEAPSVRYRGTYLLQQLERQYSVRYRHFIPYRTLFSLLRLLFLLLKLRVEKKRHLIVIQRVSSFGFYGNALRRLIRKTRHKHHFLYDLDDAIYEEMESDERIRWFMENVHQVYVGSEELKQYALNWNKNVTIITTAVIPATFCAEPSAHSTLRLGFIGCYWGTHFRNMHELVFPALSAVTFPVELVIIGAAKEEEREETVQYFQKNNQVTVVFRDITDWMNEDDINKAMLDWDLGLAPLRDTVVCRAKSAFKVKQYLNLGIPVLSTRVGENGQFVVHEENGYFFETPEELAIILERFQVKTTDERMLLVHNAKAGASVFHLDTIATNWLDGLTVR